MGSVTVAGSLQSELGCPADWDPACAATHLAFDTPTASGTAPSPCPAGELRVEGRDQRRLDGQLRRRRRQRQHPAHRGRGGDSYVFTWDQLTHVPSAAPAP